MCSVRDELTLISAVRKALALWVFGWQKKGFKGKKNPDLWRRFLDVYHRHNVKFEWIKGHAGHKENERCDKLATTAAQKKELLIDEGFEAQENTMF